MGRKAVYEATKWEIKAMKEWLRDQQQRNPSTFLISENWKIKKNFGAQEQFCYHCTVLGNDTKSVGDITHIVPEGMFRYMIEVHSCHFNIGNYSTS